ncbi:hypothetical protein Q3G72_033677 [Acer saccharum]|nr:hypothetical protein Q3G72_033677 [Acer saccharum]
MWQVGLFKVRRLAYLDLPGRAFDPGQATPFISRPSRGQLVSPSRLVKGPTRSYQARLGWAGPVHIATIRYGLDSPSPTKQPSFLTVVGLDSPSPPPSLLSLTHLHLPFPLATCPTFLRFGLVVMVAVELEGRRRSIERNKGVARDRCRKIL